jgi:hypothetical protein
MKETEHKSHGEIGSANAENTGGTIDTLTL